MTLARALQVAAGNSQESADVAEAIDFDGTNDYLSRSTDLTGNTDSNKMTFSAWMYWDGYSFPEDQAVIQLGRFRIYGWATTTGFITIAAQNSSAVGILSARVQGSNVLTGLQKGWVSFIISFDLSNTSKRSCYINDQLVTVSWLTYTNDNISTFISGYPITVARDNGQYGSNDFYKGRLSNVFLDYTYRDLSVTANRRLFVTADLKPAAGQAALNPILYLPMDDPTAPGFNAGTGGNFTMTGTVARSGRGPNQYNAPYSDLDGTADFLSRASLSGIADGKQFTFACCFNADSFNNKSFLDINTGSSTRFHIRMTGTTGAIQVIASNSSGTTILNFYSEPFDQLKLLRNYVMVVSGDMNDSSTFKISVNGEFLTTTLGLYSNDTIDFTSVNTVVGRDLSSRYFDGRLGAVWFNTSYIDLSVAANLAKFVTGTGIDAKPVDLGANGELPTGTSPLIYLPMYGNNAGKNYGTGGDFTVNSGPYTGARGPNEYWGNKADFNGTTGYLSRTSALSGVSDGKTFSCSFYFMPDSSASLNYLFRTSTSGGDYTFFIRWDGASNTMDIRATGIAGSPVVLTVSSFNNITAGGTYSVQCSVDLTDTAKRALYVNGVNSASSWSTYTNANMGLSVPNVKFSDPVGYFNGRLSEFYFTTEYIDFTQEANRLKFRDAFGNPVNLTQQIEDAAIPNPAIYMRFPPTAFGTNSGTGGNFTVNGTITDGGQL